MTASDAEALQRPHEKNLIWLSEPGIPDDDWLVAQAPDFAKGSRLIKILEHHFNSEIGNFVYVTIFTRREDGRYAVEYKVSAGVNYCRYCGAYLGANECDCGKTERLVNWKQVEEEITFAIFDHENGRDTVVAFLPTGSQWWEGLIPVR